MSAFHRYRLLHNLTFHMRIRVTLIVIIAIAVSSTGWGSYYIAAGIVESHAEQAGQESINKLKLVLEEKMRQIAVSVMTLMISDAFKAAMRDVAMADASGYPTHLSSLQSHFAQIKLNEPMLQNVLVSTPIGDFYNTGFIRTSDRPFQLSAPYYRLKSAGTNLWLEAHEDPFFTGHERVISLLMEPLSDILVSDVYLVVNVREAGLLEMLQSNLSEPGGAILLVAPDGSEVLTSDQALWGQIRAGYSPVPSEPSLISGRLSPLLDKDDYVVNYAKLPMNEGWTLISVQKKSELFKQMDRIRWLVVAVVAGCTILALLLSRMLTLLLMKPLHTLKSLMLRVESSDLSVRFESPYQDEFSRVGLRFNRMLEQIEQLIETVREAETEKRKSEVKALQAQISPHFLYNTLNAIYWRTQLGQHGDVGDMVLSLSKLFQLGLNSGSEMTTVDKELTHVEQYLLLQQRCYEGLFVFDIDLKDESLRSFPLLKLLLQPLVENAILHGFQKRHSGGEIRIEAAASGQKLVFVIRDNGKGMDAGAVLLAIRTQAAEGTSGHTGSYALRNIYNRLQLYYGSEAALHISSQPGQGTEVRLEIPLSEPLDKGDQEDE
ncbi:cache domain-containing sensor histidine kinase [Paenibacillus puerhi]|uniref:cache domain-containing sensor histidine kinase n=1 Tax=Paenibacillus puerhi TaxID=2692622 RepID=UPI0013588A2D|nr:sensor histidine kinase [Paenibacillus puerhi]